jgi:hypothetical protein
MVDHPHQRAPQQGANRGIPHPTDERGAPAFPATPTPPSAPASGTDTVTVACKLANGLILRVFDETVESRPVLGGGVKEEKVFLPTGTQYVVRGPIVNLGAYRQAGELPDGIVGGYALTPGIPRDFWERWLDQNKHSDLVRNQIVFASSSYDRASGQARDMKDVKSGLEPLDPDNPTARNPRDFAGITRGEHAPGARAA